jgi:hypothetical protein
VGYILLGVLPEGGGNGGGENGKHHRRHGSDKPMQIRIHRASNAFHIVTLAPHINVANLTPALNAKLLQGKDVETHRLYLKEWGRGMSFFRLGPLTRLFLWQNKYWRRKSDLRILLGGGWSKLDMTRAMEQISSTRTCRSCSSLCTRASIGPAVLILFKYSYYTCVSYHRRKNYLSKTLNTSTSHGGACIPSQ